MTWKFFNSGINSGQFNMDFDLFLAENLMPDTAVLRLYRWNPYCISVGANQSINDINLNKIQAEGIDLVIRPTGGKAILHSQELTYSVVYPIDYTSSVRNIYDEINIALRKGLINFNRKLSDVRLENIQPDFKEFYKSKLNAICFAISAKSELNYYGKKLVGSAQRKLGNVILQHGSILCGSYHLKIIDYLNVTDQFKSEMFQELSNSTIDLKSILNTQIDYALLNNSIIKGFEEHFNLEFEELDQAALGISMIA